MQGCASAPDWTKPGADRAQLASDIDACDDETRAETQRGYAIATDIAAVHANDWRNLGVGQAQMDKLNAQESGDQSTDLFKACMTDRGYRPVE